MATKRARPKPQTYEELKTHWYAKLAAGGFDDIEAADGRLKRWSNTFAKNASKFQNKEEYYRMAGRFLHDHKFKNATDKKIWELHSEGLSLDKISLSMPDQNITRDKAFKVIKHYATIMKSKPHDNE